MIKFGLLLAIVAVFSSASLVSANTCNVQEGNIFTGINDFVDFKDACTTATAEQIQKEVTASLQYLKMAAHFSRDDINRPGFAKFFYGAASEEREHAYKLIEYLSMRGRYVKESSVVLEKFNISKLVTDTENAAVKLLGVEVADLNVVGAKTTAGLIALQNALKLEVAVTKSIRALISTCEGNSFNHYHFVDYLTGEFLEEQYKGQRELAGKISTLGKMVQNQGAELADFLFDKQL